MKAYEGLFSTSTLDGREGLTSRPYRFNSGKEVSVLIE
jgi:hypothetical protein